ncbi:hypothetical protein F5Y14DRAFT_440157 [Nemania sp. NC0429]|nr:hypothetical protein F5Y14DRAFT_440157 [Nemania sp. NC0429]
MTRPSTATSADRYQSHDFTDLLEPALDSPPSPEGIRAFSRRVKRGSIAEQQSHELVVPSGSSSSPSETPEMPWEHGLENPSLSRNPSQRSSVMRFKERPDSVQLFGKAVFSRKPKLRRGVSDQGHASSSLLSLSEIPDDSAPDLPKEQRFIQSMFTRRRARGVSEASLKKVQISGPYDFQHVSHSTKEVLPQANRPELLPGFSGARPRTTTNSNRSGGFNPQAIDKPLPTPPDLEEVSEHVSSRDSIQFSPPGISRYLPDDTQTSPVPPPPRTSSRISVRHDRTDSFGAASLGKLRNPGYQAQPFVLPSTEGLWPPPVSHVTNGYSEGGDERSPYPISTVDDTAWPLTGSMSSLPEVPEEEEYHLTNVISRTSVMSNKTSLRGSISVPHLRRISLSQAAPRPPSNASDTLGRFDSLAAQRALHEYEEDEIDQDYFVQDSWEDDIDYCYDHEAEADCDFVWERLSCDHDRDDYFTEDSTQGHRAEPSFGGFGLAPTSLLSSDVPGLSPTSHRSGATPCGATTPTGLTAPITSNFSLPRIDSSTQLKRDHHRSDSSISSFREADEFCLSPSLLIPNDYHEKMLQYERDEFKMLPNDDQSPRFDRPEAFLHARSSASTTISTLSEQSGVSSRYPSSTFTRWTGSSSSSWQVQIDPQQPVTITLNDKEPVITPTNEIAMIASEPSATPLKQETGRDGHSRAQSEATLLTKATHAAVASLESNVAKESLKTHRRTRTGSRSHANVTPQFALFPQIPQRPLNN